ncbi:MAG: (Fe-S)-binding protein [Polyangiaceae bacterium]
MTVKLTMLAEHRDALEKCVFCPKLCRAACPVSNAEPSESLTPWGKMSTAYFVAGGSAPADDDSASLAWACTGCLGCRELCDHKNPVADVLFDARAAHTLAGHSPAAARAVADDAEAHRKRHRVAIAELDPRRSEAIEASPGGLRLLLGCGYAEAEPSAARAAMAVTKALYGDGCTLVEECCGYPLLAAGDLAGFRAQAERLAREVAGAHPLVVLDPGCARTLSHHYARMTPPIEVVTPELLLDRVARSLDKLEPSAGPSAVHRWHDPCQLGRGLGKYDEPRAILKRALGEENVAEPERARERAECSGGGGLVPQTMPAVSDAIAGARLEEHERLGGGVIVTGCASSLARFKKSGSHAMDLIEVVARALGVAPAPSSAAENDDDGGPVSGPRSRRQG